VPADNHYRAGSAGRQSLPRRRCRPTIAAAFMHRKYAATDSSGAFPSSLQNMFPHHKLTTPKPYAMASGSDFLEIAMFVFIYY